jgi:hypothetical protein
MNDARVVQLVQKHSDGKYRFAVDLYSFCMGGLTSLGVAGSDKPDQIQS